MGDADKLTKKQKKAQAFRERKGRSRVKDLDEDNAVPLAEDQDRVEILSMEARTEDKPKQINDTSMVSKQGHKRKRDQKDEHDSEPKSKKQKEGSGETVSGGSESQEMQDARSEKKAKKSSKEDVKQRFILFVGRFA